MVTKKTIGIVLAILLIVAAVVMGVVSYLQSVDVSTLDPAVAPFITFLIGFATLMPVTTAVAFMRGIFGFVFEWIKSDYTETFSDPKLYATLTLYIGLVTIIGAAIPAPFGEIGVIIILVADIARQLLKSLWGK